MLSALLALCIVADASAQDGTSLTVLGDASSFDLSGTGTSWVIEGAAGYRLTGHLGIEGGLRLFHYEAQSTEEISYLFPEVGIQTRRSPCRANPRRSTSQSEPIGTPASQAGGRQEPAWNS